MPRRIEDPTPEQLRKRRQSREWRRRKKAAELAATNATATHCQRKQGPGKCGARLEHRIVQGRVVTTCPGCARRQRGICRLCPAKVAGTVGYALYCEPCKRDATKESARRHYRRNRTEILRRDKKWRDALPDDVKASRLMQKKMWRRANPERVAASKARERERRREKILAYHRERRARLREQIREKARVDYYKRKPVLVIPPCVECGAPIQWAPPGRPKKRCDACVPPSVRARRRPVVPEYVRPTIEAPLRTCITPGCDIVVTHRRKKFDRCKQKHTAVARMLRSARAHAA